MVRARTGEKSNKADNPALRPKPIDEKTNWQV